MPRMTDEEADALAEQVITNPPNVSGDGKSGFFMKHKNEIVILDNVSATWLRLKAEAANTTADAIIRQMVDKEIAASAL